MGELAVGPDRLLFELAESRPGADRQQLRLEVIVDDTQIDSGRHFHGNPRLGRAQLRGQLWTDKRRESRAEHLSERVASHGEPFRTAKQVLGFPKFWRIAGIGELDWEIFPSDGDPGIDALCKLLHDWLCIRGIAGPFGLAITAVMHQPCKAISFHELGSKNFRQASLCRTPPQIDLE